MTRFLRRVVRVARLDQEVFEEVEADRTATGEALAVVLLASVGSGIGWVGLDPSQVINILILSLAAVAGWVTWALVTYLIGTRIFGQPDTQADPGQLLRTLGFAQAPNILRILALFPGLASAVTGLTAVWTLATMVVAVRQALDYTSTGRALAVCVTGWTLALAMFWIIGIACATPVS